MGTPERFEALILGSGAGGKLLAWHLARSGRRTAVVGAPVIEAPGRTSTACPAKKEIWSANVAYVARHAAEFGTTTVAVGRSTW